VDEKLHMHVTTFCHSVDKHNWFSWSYLILCM